MKKVHPQLDQKDPSEWVESALVLNADAEADWFVENTPGFYGSEKNSAIIINWLNERNAPVTRRNLLMAYNICLDSLEQRPVEEPAREPVDDSRGIVHVPSTIRFPYTAPATEENLKQHAQNLSDLREGAPIGKPITNWLKQAYRDSLREVRETRSYSPQQIQEARAAVGMKYPDVRRDSIAFNRLVAQLLLANT